METERVGEKERDMERKKKMERERDRQIEREIKRERERYRKKEKDGKIDSQIIDYRCFRWNLCNTKYVSISYFFSNDTFTK